MINNLKQGNASYHGWVCPKCGTVHAPWVESCSCNKPKDWPGLKFPNHPIHPFNMTYKTKTCLINNI